MKTIVETDNIFLFVPNIIGYARVVLAIVSFYYMPSNYVIATWCYIVSALLDALDGHAARYFNQSTKFGAILDQLTDRCGTMGLLVTLSNFYPHCMFWFQLNMVIDIASHWIHVHSSLLRGRTSHKNLDSSDKALLKIYYSNKPLLFSLCAANELFFASLYLLNFTAGPFLIFKCLAFITAPFMLLKTFINLLQLHAACENIGRIDINEREQPRKGE